MAVVWGEIAPAKGSPARREAPLDILGLLAAAQEFSLANGVEVQLFDAAAIVNADHLRSAALHALRARERGTMRSSSVGMEMVLYAAGRRQIREALALVGLSDNTARMAAVIVGPQAQAKASGLLSALGCAPRCESRAAGGRKALLRLGFPAKGASEDQLQDLALELVALLDIER